MLLLLLACTAPDESAAPAEEDTAPELFVAPPLVPEWTVDDVEPAVSEVLATDLYLPIDLYVWFDQLFSDMAAGGLGCPDRDVNTDDPELWSSFWEGSCSGDRYSVSGDWQIAEHRSDTGGRTRISTVELHSFVGQTFPGLETVKGGGNANIRWESDGMTAQFELAFGGTYADPSQDGPISDGVSAVVSLTGSWTPTDGLVATLDGPLGGESASLDFRELSFTAGCAAPSGTLALRDPSTGWWTVALPDDCSGCGELAFEDEVLGTACPGVALTDAIAERISYYVENPP